MQVENNNDSANREFCSAILLLLSINLILNFWEKVSGS